MRPKPAAMWHDALKAAVAIVGMIAAVRLVRRQLAAMEPAERARVNRKILVGMFAGAAPVAALTLYFLGFTQV